MKELYSFNRYPCSCPKERILGAEGNAFCTLAHLIGPNIFTWIHLVVDLTPHTTVHSHGQGKIHHTGTESLRQIDIRDLSKTISKVEKFLPFRR